MYAERDYRDAVDHRFNKDDFCAITAVEAFVERLDKLGPFHAILVDEVAQATEPATLVPVLARGCSQLVLCGDHFQLPPSCASREALARGLGLSGYERLVSQGTEPTKTNKC